jgi:CheY-like chemotaxis protein
MTDICKILFVDDIEDVRYLVAKLLNSDEYAVKTASSEQEAMALLTAEHFHFIIIDIRLRGNDEDDESGLELAKKIRKNNVRSKIIFITGNTIKVSHFNAGWEYGVIGYFEKSGNWVDAIRELIEENFMKFDVFLCHNSKDKPAIKRVGRELMIRGLRPWLDEWELRPGLIWQELIEKQMEEIKSAAVFVGRDGVGPWQNQEIRALLNQFVKRNCPVIPVILENASQMPDLPLFLQNMTWVDFRNSDPDPMRQLIWGITGKK